MSAKKLYITRKQISGRKKNEYKSKVVRAGTPLRGDQLRDLGYTVKDAKKLTEYFEVVLSDKIPTRELDEIIADDACVITEDTMSRLTNPELFETMVQSVTQICVGESTVVRMLTLVAGGGRVTINVRAASTNVAINSETGAGKDFTTGVALSPFPKETVLIHRNKLTPQAFTYMKQDEIKDGFTWDGMIVYIEDCPTRLLNCDTFKTMSTGGSSATVVKDQKSIDILIPGKPIIIITTAEGEPNAELVRRFPMIQLDESPEQTHLIMDKIADAAEAGISETVPGWLRDVLLALKRVRVKVPFAKVLARHFKDYDAIVFRTHFPRILDYVKMCAALHQFQREQRDGFVVAQWADWDMVRTVVEATTEGKRGMTLTHKQQKLMNLIKDNPRSSAPTIVRLKGCPYSRKGCYNALSTLTQRGYLISDSEVNNGRDVDVYSVAESEQDIFIPSSEELQNKSNSLTTPTTSTSLTTPSTPKANDSVVGVVGAPNIQGKQSEITSFIASKGGIVERLALAHEFGDDRICYYVTNGILQETGNGGIRVAK